MKTAEEVLRAGAPMGNQDGVVQAAWSSQARQAALLSRKAHSASAEAAESSDFTLHRAATEAHREAADFHRGQLGTSGKSERVFHETSAKVHDTMANHHADLAEELDDWHAKASSSAPQPNIVTAQSGSDDVVYCRGHTSELTVTATSQWEQDKEVQFMYMPSGTHTICAGFRGKSIELTVTVDPNTAAAVLQASIEQLQASQPRQRPFGCIEHEEKDASVWAKKFVAKDDGVYLCAEPSSLGVTHVNGRIHRSWSPSFLTDADYTKATLEDGTYTFPDGVRGSVSNPAKIVGCAFCVGTLTNKPAFREMSPVKARQATMKTEEMVQAAKGAKPGNQNAAGPHRHLPSQNESWGYYGTVDKDHYDSFEHMSRAVHPHVMAAGGTHEDTRNFLDSAHGRHLAQSVNAGASHENALKEYTHPTRLKQLVKKVIGSRDLFTSDDDLAARASESFIPQDNDVVSASTILTGPRTASDVLRAMWSSQARQAALEARKRGQHADMLSDRAGLMGRPEDHQAAAAAHDKAARLHSKASKSAEQSGQLKDAEEHELLAYHHSKLAGEHRQ